MKTNTIANPKLAAAATIVASVSNESLATLDNTGLYMVASSAASVREACRVIAGRGRIAVEGFASFLTEMGTTGEAGAEQARITYISYSQVCKKYGGVFALTKKGTEYSCIRAQDVKPSNRAGKTKQSAAPSPAAAPSPSATPAAPSTIQPTAASADRLRANLRKILGLAADCTDAALVTAVQRLADATAKPVPATIRTPRVRPAVAPLAAQA